LASSALLPNQSLVATPSSSPASAGAEDVQYEHEQVKHQGTTKEGHNKPPMRTLDGNPCVVHYLVE
jgi:hypothetical protein